MKVLELYSGIGGMHLAMKESGLDGEIKASIDINPVANSIYRHNFPNTPLFNSNLDSVNAEFFNNLDVDTIFMSPPCQPFTRNGTQDDVDDTRTNSFNSILQMLHKMTSIKKILIENVKGFESSKMRVNLIETLTNCGFTCTEFILSPCQIGIPNTRHRYYCLAKKSLNYNSKSPTKMLLNFPGVGCELKIDCFPISEIVENSNLHKFYLNEKILTKYVQLLDICHPQSRRSCCFTKAYSRFIEGTGSVYTEQSPQLIESVFTTIASLSKSNEEYLQTLQTLKLRFFTPREVCRLMCFPESFQFPPEISDRQKYMVLGNSINIKVVSELIKCL